MRPITVTVGPLATAVSNGICLSQSPSGAGALTLNGSLVANGVAVLDVARRVAITSTNTDNNKTFTITGTSASGNIQTEVLLGPDTATVYTNLDFKTVTNITVSAATTGAITIGTNTVASSSWVYIDPYAFPQMGFQCTVNGSVSYTVQQTYEDPNSPTNPTLPYLVTWVNNPTAALVNSSSTQQSSYLIAPLYVKVTLNSGTGYVNSTFVQFGNLVS